MSIQAPVALVLLTAEEVLVVRAYRSCSLDNREHVRHFIHAAAADYEGGSAELIPFVARKKT
jgi:hypothetical protein